MDMTDKAVRLALVQLTYTHAREADESVKRAEELEGYVLGNTASSAPAGSSKKLSLNKRQSPKGDR